MTNQEAERLLDAARRNPEAYGLGTCLVCGIRKTIIFGIFTPHEHVAAKYGAPKGKCRMIGYGLCRECSELRDVHDRVERVLIRKMRVH